MADTDPKPTPAQKAAQSHAAKPLAQEAYKTFPPEKRHARAIANHLKTLGYTVSKSTVSRWIQQWPVPVDPPAPPRPRRPRPPSAPKPPKHVDVEIVTAALLTPPAVIPPGAAKKAEPLPMLPADIPQQFVDALGPRLLFIARGKGLDRVESAVVLLADAIGARAADIAGLLLEAESETETTESVEAGKKTRIVQKGQVVRSAVGALAQLAAAMQSITASRVALSVAHRNFGEGDSFAAIADKTSAEAEHIRGEARGEHAAEIAGDYTEVPPDTAAQAFDALKGLTGAKDTSKAKK